MLHTGLYDFLLDVVVTTVRKNSLQRNFLVRTLRVEDVELTKHYIVNREDRRGRYAGRKTREKSECIVIYETSDCCAVL